MSTHTTRAARAAALSSPVRVKGTAVFMSSNANGVPPVLLHHFKHNQCLHEQVVLLTVLSMHVPEVSPVDRVSIEEPAKMSRWRKALFAFVSRNAVPATAYFGLPPGRVVELGMQIDL